MRIDTRPRHRNSPRPAEKSAPGFLQWLRGRDCPVCLAQGETPTTRIEAAHVDYAGGKGMASKVADKWAIPLCSMHHHEQHTIGWKQFEAKYSLDAKWGAGVYWNRWPGRAAWERKNDTP